MFSLENGLTTPTLKMKRADIRRYFKDTIERLYDEPILIESKL